MRVLSRDDVAWGRALLLTRIEQLEALAEVDAKSSRSELRADAVRTREHVEAAKRVAEMLEQMHRVLPVSSTMNEESSEESAKRLIGAVESFFTELAEGETDVASVVSGALDEMGPFADVIALALLRVVWRIQAHVHNERQRRRVKPQPGWASGPVRGGSRRKQGKR